MSAIILSWNDKIPIKNMRFEIAFRSNRNPKKQSKPKVLGKQFCYLGHNDKGIVFRISPKVGHQGSGAMLKSYRSIHNMNKSKAARILGVSQPTIGKFESGERMMLLKHVLKIEHKINWELVDDSFYKMCKNQRVFRCSSGGEYWNLHIKAFGRYYKFFRITAKNIVFKAAPKPVEPKHKRTYLTEFREKLGWTQNQLAKALGLSRDLVAKCETGENNFDHPCKMAIRMLNTGSSLEELKRAQKQYPDFFRQKLNRKTSTPKQSDEDRFATFIRSVEKA